jgi:hypothetical protein
MSFWWFVGLFVVLVLSYRLAIVYVLVSMVVVIAGCASVESEKDVYNRQVDIENWARCEYIYELAGQYTYHLGHTHTNKWRVNHWDIQSDLQVNHCRMILKKIDWWAEKW